MGRKISSGLRDYILATGSIKDGLEGGVIRIYSGDEPATGDAAIGGSNTLLCLVSESGGGTGLTFEATPSGGVLAKSVSEVWTGTNLASGTPSFFRFSSLTDAEGSSTSEKRLQGTIGTAGNIMNISTSPLVSGAACPITYFNLSLATE